MRPIPDQTSRRETAIICRELRRLLDADVNGDVVEFGCYEGATSLLIAEMLGEGRALHVYDSFAGLPDKLPQDRSPAGEQFKAGELAASKAQFIRVFKRRGLKLPAIHKAWFEDLTTDDVPERVCFAFLDGDYYSSIRSSFGLIEDRLTPGAVVVVDDYSNEALPGAARAVDEWLARNRSARLQVEASLAIIHI